MTAGRSRVGWVHAVLAAYVVGFVAFWPKALVITDEERYVSQAAAFAAGHRVNPGAEMLYPTSAGSAIVDYPPGTSLLQAPFVWAFGWRGAVLLSVVAVVVATLATRRWIAESGREPTFALVVPGFAGVALFGRVAMSDVPSTAVVALTCLLLWRADSVSKWRSLMVGLFAGGALLFREPLVALMGPLVAMAVFRKRIALWRVIVGAIASLLLRFGLAVWLFGDPLHVRDSLYGFSLGALRHGLPTYSVILLLLLPAGLALLPAYRGERRAELSIAAAAYVAVFLLYGYDPVRENGGLNGWVLASRFMAPLTPLLAFMAAEVWPRWVSRWPWARQPLALVACLCALAVAVAVHPLAASRERSTVALVGVLHAHTTPEIPVVTNTRVSLKYLSPVYGPRRLAQRYDLPGDSLGALARRFGAVDVALLDRTEGTMFEAEERDNAAFLRLASSRCRVIASLDTTVSGLRTHFRRLEQCR